MLFSSGDRDPRNWIAGKLLHLVWRMTPDCREVTRLSSEGLDRLLPLGTRLRLGLHRRFCKWCARYARQLDFLDKASHLFAAHVDQLSGPSLSIDAKSRLKRTLQREATRESRQAPRRNSVK
jgi:hypothetical protein